MRQSASGDACSASVVWPMSEPVTADTLPVAADTLPVAADTVPVAADTVTATGLACVVNVSEGQDEAVLADLSAAAGDCLLDVHRDWFHHRSVLTLGSLDPVVLQEAVRAVAARAVALVDLTAHRGVHPRSGAIDVVPFVPLLGAHSRPAGPDDDLGIALAAREDFASWAAQALGLPCFFYGPERTLPAIRRQAFVKISPDRGPPVPHPSAGWCAVGARPALVAFNVWLDTSDVDSARQIAAELRRPGIRTLGFDVGGQAQVSCNLVDPYSVGPADVVALVEAMARARHLAVERAELVGLVPARVLEHTPPDQWARCDLDPERTVEARLRHTTFGRRSRSPI